MITSFEQHFILGYMGNPKILVGSHHFVWDLRFEGMQFFYAVICSFDLDIRCSGAFSHHLKFYSFMHNYFFKSKTF